MDRIRLKVRILINPPILRNSGIISRGSRLAKVPSKAPGQSLPYTTDLSADDFERLCSDLLAEQDDIVDADLNGLPRKLEHGVDVLGVRGDHSRVGLQAKRYQKASPDELVGWTATFLGWADHWKKVGVDHFILVVTIDTRDPKRREAIETCRQRCEAAGFTFDFWHKRAIDRLLKRCPSIVRDYFGAAWEAEICGPSLSVPSNTRTQIKLDLARTHLSEDVGKLAAAFDSGDESSVKTLLERLTSAAWDDLTDTDKRTVLQIRCIRALTRADNDEVSTILADPLLEGNFDIRAIHDLTLQSGGTVEEIIERYPEASAVVRAQLLLAADRLAEAAEALADPETALELAMRARVEAARGDRAVALQFASDAVEESDNSVAVIGSALAARLACCAAPDFIYEPGAVAPEPPPFGMMRQDASFFLEIEKMLSDIESLNGMMTVAHGRLDIVAWKVALLSFLPSRHHDATKVFVKGLEQDVPSAMSIVWAIDAGLVFDAHQALRAIRRSLREKTAGPEHVFVAAALLENEGKSGEARSLFGRFGGRFRHLRGFQDTETYWKERLKSGLQPDALGALLLKAVQDGDWAPPVAHVQNQLTEKPIQTQPDLLRLANALAAHGEWAALEPLLKEVEKVGTRDAYRIVAFGNQGLKMPREVLRVLEIADVFTSAVLPRDLTHLKADALEATGRPLDALEVRRQLPSPTVSDQTQLAGALLRAGKVPEAATLFDQLSAGDLPSQFRIQAAAAIRPDRPDIARRLIVPILENGEVPDEQLSSLYDVSSKLGLQGLAEFAVKRIVSGNVAGVLRIDTIEEALAFMNERERAIDDIKKKYFNGEIPMALYAEARGGTVAAHIFGLDQMPILARHGSRLPPHSKFVEAKAAPLGFAVCPSELSKTLVLDYPAIILIQQFDLFDEILSRVDRFLIPAATLTALGEERAVLTPEEGKRGNAISDQLRELGRSRELPAYEHTVIFRLDELFTEESSGADEPDFVQMLAGLRPETPVLLPDSVVFELIREDRFEDMLERLSIYVTEGFGNRMEGMSNRGEAKKACLENLGSLARKLDEHISSEKIEILLHNDEALRGGPQSSAILSMQQLLAGRYSLEATIISGDRFIAGYRRVGATPALDIETLVHLLEAEGTLSETRARRVRHEMREAGLLFLSDPAPDMAAELIKPNFDTAGAAAKQRLQVQRVNMASAILHSKHLRIDSSKGQNGQGNEASIVRDASLTALEAIREIWANEDNSLQAMFTKSDVVVDGFLYLRVPGNPIEQGDKTRHWAAQTYGMLLSTIFIISMHDHTRVKPFMRWFEGRFGFDLLNDATISSVAVRTSEMGLEAITELMADDDMESAAQVHRLMTIAANEACKALPESLLHRFDKTLVDKAGLQLTQFVEIGSHRVSLEAIRKGLRSSEAERTVLSVDDVKLPIRNPRQAAFAIEADGCNYSFVNADFDLLAIDPKAPVEEIQGTVPWIGSLAEVDKVRNLLATEATPTNLNQAARAVYGSIPIDLERAAQPDAQVDPKQFYPPAPDVLFAALGLHPDGGLSAFDELPTPCGPSDAALLIARRLNVPRQLHLDKLFIEVVPQSVIETAIQSAKSPVARLMALTLSASAGDTIETEQPTKGGFDLCTALVRWSLRRFDRDPRWQRISKEMRLVAAWFHSGELCVALQDNGLRNEFALNCDVVDGWDPKTLAHEMGNRLELERDVCGKEVSGDAIILALLINGENADAPEAFLETLDEIEIIKLAETSVLPDMLDSVISKARYKFAPDMTSRNALLSVSHIESELSTEQLDLSETRDPTFWNIVLHFCRRGPSETSRENVLTAWKELDFEAQCARDKEWLLTGLMFVKAFGPDLSAADLSELLRGCDRVQRFVEGNKPTPICEELRVHVAMQLARLDDTDWNKVVDELVSSLVGNGELWRRALTDDLFAITPLPERAADLLRHLRAQP